MMKRVGFAYFAGFAFKSGFFRSFLLFSLLCLDNQHTC